MFDLSKEKKTRKLYHPSIGLIPVNFNSILINIIYIFPLFLDDDQHFNFSYYFTKKINNTTKKN
jgi:hypothetical protein